MKYIETGSTDPYYNLAFEEYLLTRKTDDEWIMLWQNANTVVIGLNQNTEEEINGHFVREHAVNVVRRSTGGGAVYHDLGNINYSFIFEKEKSEEQGSRYFTQPVCEALGKLGAKAEASGRNDILIDGRKVSGTAQRLYNGRILHHGTLLFASDPEMIAGALNADPEKFTSKGIKSVRSRVGNIRDYLPSGMTVERFFIAMREALAAQAERVVLTAEELEEISRLADSKYRTWEWNWGRSPDYNYVNKKRFPGGKMEVCMNISEGRIKEIDFHGDYMALTPSTPAKEALTGARFTAESVGEILSGLELPLMFGTIGKDEILSLLF